MKRDCLPEWKVPTEGSSFMPGNGAKPFLWC